METGDEIQPPSTEEILNLLTKQHEEMTKNLQQLQIQAQKGEEKWKLYEHQIQTLNQQMQSICSSTMERGESSQQVSRYPEVNQLLTSSNILPIMSEPSLPVHTYSTASPMQFPFVSPDLPQTQAFSPILLNHTPVFRTPPANTPAYPYQPQRNLPFPQTPLAYTTTTQAPPPHSGTSTFFYPPGPQQPHHSQPQTHNRNNSNFYPNPYPQYQPPHNPSPSHHMRMPWQSNLDSTGVQIKTVKLEFPTFNGDNCDEWVYKVQQFFTHYNIPDN